MTQMPMTQIRLDLEVANQILESLRDHGCDTAHAMTYLLATFVEVSFQTVQPRPTLEEIAEMARKTILSMRVGKQ